MKIKKKVNEVKEKAKEFCEKHGETMAAIVSMLIGTLVYGFVQYQIGRHDQRKDMGDLTNIWLEMPIGVKHDVYKFSPILENTDEKAAYPFYIVAAERDTQILGLDKYNEAKAE